MQIAVDAKHGVFAGAERGPRLSMGVRVKSKSVA